VCKLGMDAPPRVPNATFQARLDSGYPFRKKTPHVGGGGGTCGVPACTLQEKAKFTNTYILLNIFLLKHIWHGKIIISTFATFHANFCIYYFYPFSTYISKIIWVRPLYIHIYEITREDLPYNKFKNKVNRRGGLFYA